MDETTALTSSGNRMIVCGWCRWDTEAGQRCQHCQHERPEQPWEQRGDTPPRADNDRETGRPRLDASQIHERLRIARKQLGADVTNAALAHHLGVSERTLGRWQKLSG